MPSDLELVSLRMRAVKRKNTRPEVLVRKVLHSLGLRFRIHVKSLPGTPDIVLKKHNTVIFVHGCFWHRHESCRYSTMPKSRQEFWVPKFEANVKRDLSKAEALRALGWQVLTVWECETRHLDLLKERLRDEFD